MGSFAKSIGEKKSAMSAGRCTVSDFVLGRSVLFQDPMK